MVVIDDPARGEFPTPVDAVGTDPTHVGGSGRRSMTRMPLTCSSVATTYARGAALNTAQIAELLAAEFTG